MADPKVFIGLLIGGSVSFLFSALAIRAVGRTAGVVVQEVRSQFADGGIMAGTKKPDYGPVIDICTAASLRELATPALLAVLTPVIVGFGINFYALGAFLAGVILTGQLMANFLSNSGGAWDNAKKYIEDGNEGGKGSEAHKAAVIGDTVGDPFKDTAGPALNPLIKVMNLVSLLILPAVISLRNDDVRLRDRRRRPRGAHRCGGVLEAQGRRVRRGVRAVRGGRVADRYERHRVLDSHEMEERPSPIAYAIGGLLPIAVAGAMVGLRDEVDNTNVALVLVLVRRRDRGVRRARTGRAQRGHRRGVVRVLLHPAVLLAAHRQLERRRDRSSSCWRSGSRSARSRCYAQRSRRQATAGRDELASMRRVAERVAAGASDRS